MSAAGTLVVECASRGLTIATAESITAGLVAGTIAQVPGCSAVLRGGVVAYASEVKRDLLRLDPALLAHVVSGEVAAALAEAATAIVGADLGIGTTGVAGPDALDGQPVGTVWIAVHEAGSGRTEVRRLALAGDRAAIRAATVEASLALALRVLGLGE